MVFVLFGFNEKTLCFGIFEFNAKNNVLVPVVPWYHNVIHYSSFALKSAGRLKWFHNLFRPSGRLKWVADLNENSTHLSEGGRLN